MGIESRPRKLSKLKGASKQRTRAKPIPFVDADDFDDDDSSPLEERIAAKSPSESEDDESNAGVSDEDEEDDNDDDDEEGDYRRSPSPVEDLTFGQILKRREKTAPKTNDATATTQPADTISGSKDPLAARPGRATDTIASAKRPKPARPHRMSKHAPTEVSSRFAVKRGRDWTNGDASIAGVSVRPAAERARDPRFTLAAMALAPPSRATEDRARKNYAFLDEYRDAELQHLRTTLAEADRARKAALKRRGDRAAADAESLAHEVADLRRQIASMEGRKNAREAKDKAQAVLDTHRQRERELVRQGKTPFFLKRSEQKKRLLVDQFAGMSEQQVSKTLERRRKKAAMRERREMPLPRRT